MGLLRGRAWLFGDDVNTDVLHPPQFFSLDPERVKAGLFFGIDASIQPRIEPGDIVVAGRNFGCGSSRETSIRALKLNHIGAIVALDFARIFFRNATNNGLPCLTFREASDRISIRSGERLAIAPERGLMTTADGKSIALDPPGAFVQRIWEAGGLLNLLPASER